MQAKYHYPGLFGCVPISLIFNYFILSPIQLLCKRDAIALQNDANKIKGNKRVIYFIEYRVLFITDNPTDKNKTLPLQNIFKKRKY